MMFWTDHGMTGWGWATMTVGTVVFWGLLIALAVVLIRGTTGPARTGEPRPTPEQLLAERFARGEIDEDEYRRRLATLAGVGHDAPTG